MSWWIDSEYWPGPDEAADAFWLYAPAVDLEFLQDRFRRKIREHPIVLETDYKVTITDAFS